MNFQGKKIRNNNGSSKKCRSIQSMQQARMNDACCVGLNCGWAFCPNLQPFTYLQLKQYQETKINKTRLFLPLILSTNLIKRKSKIKSYSTLLAVDLRRSSQIPWVIKGILGLISLPHST